MILGPLRASPTESEKVFSFGFKLSNCKTLRVYIIKTFELQALDVDLAIYNGL